MLDCVRTFLGRTFGGLYLPLSWAVVVALTRY